MIWKITCYNGTVWEADRDMVLITALVLFCKDTGLSQVDIKRIDNLS